MKLDKTITYDGIITLFGLVGTVAGIFLWGGSISTKVEQHEKQLVQVNTAIDKLADAQVQMSQALTRTAQQLDDHIHIDLAQKKP